MDRKTLLPLVASLALLPATLLAAPKCTDAPRSSWMSEAAMKQKILDQGYAIDIFKVSGNCYEIYGKTREGKKVEIYFDPTDGRIVKQRGG
ncbi:PepSY domain-containing protein [Frateuria soli]|uniref:PepSY domain-containing protein n=1 Tax=Frateuria soli TaxID=1542730 RepID=UPI001E5F24C8|nr:PepSY domain-containing protein [Frateuria soli]UGB37614.1 PepSY domain-containing protein [Frateuria soli]